MKTSLIFSTKEFQNVGEYVAKYRHLDSSLNWDGCKKWSELADLLGVDITKWYNHARRALDKEAELLNGGTFHPKASPINNTQTLPVLPKTSVKVSKQPAALIQPAVVVPEIVVPEIVQPLTIAPVQNATPSNVDQVADAMSKALKALMFETPKSEIDESKVLEIVKGETDKVFETVKNALNEVKDIVANYKPEPKTIQVSVNNGPAKVIAGLVHEEFETILTHISVRDNVMLVGPAGSGKTTVCEQVAEALSLEFYCKSVCAQTSKAELLGYMDANGSYITTEFRKAYEFGGVFVLDEVDAGNPNVLAVLNSALANHVCAFADQMVKKHSDFVLIACANTFGLGADRQYVGRNQLDAATLDRFSVIEFNYDEALETSLSGNENLAKCVQAIRKELSNERVVISPRATIQGAKLLAAGLSPAKVFASHIAKGMPANLQYRALTIFNHYFNS